MRLCFVKAIVNPFAPGIPDIARRRAKDKARPSGRRASQVLGRSPLAGTNRPLANFAQAI
jgi:hypothetical protein